MEFITNLLARIDWADLFSKVDWNAVVAWIIALFTAG